MERLGQATLVHQLREPSLFRPPRFRAHLAPRPSAPLPVSAVPPLEVSRTAVEVGSVAAAFMAVGADLKAEVVLTVAAVTAKADPSCDAKVEAVPSLLQRL
jgi:hypothetical protein